MRFKKGVGEEGLGGAGDHHSANHSLGPAQHSKSPLTQPALFSTDNEMAWTGQDCNNSNSPLTHPTLFSTEDEMAWTG